MNSRVDQNEEVLDILIERRIQADRAQHFPELDALMQRLATKEPK